MAALVLSVGAAAQWAPGTAVKVGKAPNFLRLTPDGQQAVVANYGSNDLSVLRLDVAKPADRRVPAGFGPLGMAFRVDGEALYVANKDSGLIKEFKLPGFEMVDSLKVGHIPTDMVATPDGYSLLVANFGKGKFGRVDVLDLQKKRVVESIPVGVRPLAVVTNPGGSVAYVANSASNTVSVISLEVYKVLETIPVGDGPIGLAMSRNGRKLFIAHSRSNDLWVYDVRRKTVLHKIRAGGRAFPDRRVARRTPPGDPLLSRQRGGPGRQRRHVGIDRAPAAGEEEPRRGRLHARRAQPAGGLRGRRPGHDGGGARGRPAGTGQRGDPE